MKEHISCHLSQSFKIAGTYIWLLLLAISLLQSCDDNDEVKNKPTLYIITEPIDGLSTYGGAVQVEFLCNLDWKASTDASWITLDETSGSQSATIDARIAKNEEGADRTGTITLVAGELKKTLSITQKYRDTSTPQLEITTKNPVKLGFEGGVQAISFVCNVRWEASVDVDWISFSNATSGLEDGTLDFVVDANEGDEIREGIITIVAQGLIKTVEIVQQTEAMGGVNLLDTPEEDYSFERITTNKFWPALGEWGGSNTEGIGKFGANNTAIRVSAGSPTPRTGASYLFLRMRDNEQATSLNWLWRKLSGLIPGKSYTFSFWYKTPPEKDMVHTGNIRLGAVVDAADISNLSNPLAPEVTFGYVAASDGVLSSSDEHKKVSYTFTMPVGKTEVYIVWRRNGHQQPFLDDMSLVLNP